MPVVSWVSVPSGPQAVPARFADSCTMLILQADHDVRQGMSAMSSDLWDEQEYV
jgi:hypothetical protein